MRARPGHHPGCQHLDTHVGDRCARTCISARILPENELIAKGRPMSVFAMRDPLRGHQADSDGRSSPSGRRRAEHLALVVPLRDLGPVRG